MKEINFKKAKNKLPKSWCVMNDMSQRFKDTVIVYLNFKFNEGLNGSDRQYYGINSGGYSSESNSEFGTRLSIDEFIECFEMKMEKNDPTVEQLKAEIKEREDKIKELLAKPKYEVGKWYFVKTASGCNFIAKFNYLSNNHKYFNYSRARGEWEANNNYCMVEFVLRPATLSELKKYTTPKIKIGEHEVKWVGLTLNVGCQKFSRNDVNQLYTSMNRFGIKSITIQGHKVTIQKIDNILKLK